MRAPVALLLVLGLSGCLSAPADLKKLDALKAKLRALHGVLDELNQNIDSLEAQRDEKRIFAPTPEPVDPSDAELTDFISHLSPEDHAIVEKMKSKMKFLQATVHEEPGVDIPAEDGYAEEQPAAEEPVEGKRDMDVELKTLLDQLPVEDQELLKEHPSMWSHLSKALRTPGGDPADVVANAAAGEKRARDNHLVSRLTADDKKLLEKMRSKIGSLKSALRAEKSPVDEVQKRLVNDLRYAKENGVSLKQVLKVLMDAKRKA